MLARIWLLLLAIALASATAHSTNAELSCTELVELETPLDDLVIETIAPALPAVVGGIDSGTVRDTLSSSPSLSQVFRPPRVAS